MQRRSSQNHNVHHDQRGQQPSRPGRNHTWSYDDDFRSSGLERSGKQGRTSSRSADDDINYRTGVDYGRGQLYTGRNMSRDAKGFQNTRPGYSGGQRYEAANRQTGRERREDVNHPRYQGEGRFGMGGESRRGHYTEDDSFYEYRASLHNPYARRSAQHDMDWEDANYFDRENNRNSYSGRYNNVSYDDYRRQEQIDQRSRPRRDDPWREHEDLRHRRNDDNSRHRR
jgi:hypothetical protein